MPSSKPLYGILGVYIPLSVLILWTTLFGITFGYFAPPRPPFYPFDEKLWCLAGFLSALAASCYAALMKNSRLRHSAADVRGSIIAAAAAYGFVSLFRPALPLAERFMPCTDSVAATLAALLGWFSAISLREIFSGLELFESFTSGHRGEQLREIMREFAPEMSQTDERLRALMRNYGIEFIPPCLLIGAAGFSRHSLALTLLVFFIFSAGFLLLGFLRLLRRELSYASEGISLSIRDRVLPVPIMALGIGVAAILGVAGSAEASLLPPEIILGFLMWLGKLLASLFRSPDPGELNFPERRTGPGQGNLADLFPPVEETGPWEGWKWIKYGFIAILAFLFLYFMIYPLLKRSGLLPSALKIRAAVARWFADLKRGLSAFFTALKDRGDSQKYKPDREKLRRIASELLSGNSRKEVKRSVNLFVRLILWGIETIGVDWRPSHAPGEYCGLLAAALAKNPAAPEPAAEARQGRGSPPEPAEKVIRCGELFEKALYSARPLSPPEEKEFKGLVEGITG